MNLNELNRLVVRAVSDVVGIIVNRHEESQRGYCRAKFVVLDTYDGLATAAQSGQPYQTRLNPGPADPHVAHPPRERTLMTPHPSK